MRWVKLIGKSIVELSKNFKLSLLVVMIGLILSETGFHFFNGFSQGLYISTINRGPHLRTYSVSNITNYDYFKISYYLSNSKEYDIEDISLKIVEIPIDNKSAKVISFNTDKIDGIYSGDLHSMSFNSDLSEPYCIITRNLVDPDKGTGNIGSYINIAGKQFKVYGIIEMPYDGDETPSAFIPINEFKQINEKINNINIKASRVLDDNQYEKLVKYISTISNNAKLQKFESYEKQTSDLADSYFQRIIMYLLICAMSIVNSLLLLKFWFEKSKKENLCYRISGATNLKLFVIMFTELITLVIISEILSILLFEVFFRKIFTIYGVLIILGVKEYMFSSGLIFLVASASILIMIYNALKSNKEWRITE